MALPEYAPVLDRAAGLMSALANCYVPPDPGRPAAEGGDGTPAGPPPHPDVLRQREQAEEKLVALAGEYREVIEDLMILREHVSGRSPAGGVRQSSDAAEAVEYAPAPATPPPPLDTTPGYPPVESDQVQTAARDIPRAVRNMGNDGSPGATVPDRQNRIVRADALVERVAELGYERAAAAWAVHLLVGRGELVPEVRKEYVEVGERWVPDVEGVMAELYRTDWRHFDPPMKKVSGQFVEQPTWAGGGPVPFECLLVRSTPRLWAPAARPPAPPPGSCLSVSTRPRTVEPPGGRVEAALRDLPGVMNNAPDAPGVTTRPGERAVVYHMLRSGLEKNGHQRDAAEWAIHRHVEAGRLLVEPGVVGLPAAVTAGRVVAGGGRGRTYDRELCLLRSTAALWDWWREEERAPAPVHPDHGQVEGYVPQPFVTSAELWKGSRGVIAETVNQSPSTDTIREPPASTASGATPPDGPAGGCWLWFHGKRYGVPKGVVYKLLAHMWVRESARYDDLMGTGMPVWDDPVEPQTVRSKVSEANKVLKVAGVPWRLSADSASRHVTKAVPGPKTKRTPRKK
jgi:hypothetical protein